MGTHINVDILYLLVRDKRNYHLTKTVIEFLSFAFCIVFVSWVVPYVQFSFSIHEVSTALVVPKWTVKASMLVGGILMAAHFMVRTIKYLLAFKDKKYLWER